MASTRNAYELLLGGDDQPFKPAGGKKKQKKKKQAAPEGAGSEPAVQARAPVAVEEEDGEFQPVPQHHVIKSRAAPEVRRAGSDKEVTGARASDACAALEKEAAAAAAAGASARAALAAKWAEKALLAASGARYTDGNKQLDFKQVLAKSRALDQLVDGYLSVATAADAGPLAALLEAVAHPTAPAGLSESLAHAVVGLGQLASTDPLSVSSDACNSVSAALALLKGGLQARAERSAANGSASQLSALSTKLDKLEAQLPKTTLLKEQVRLWGEIYAAAQQKLDIVSKGGAGGLAAPELQAALDPLQALQTSLTGRIKEVQRIKSGATIESQLARAEATYKSEDAAMQERQAQVEERVKVLEAELAGLRQEAAQLKDRRTWAAQHHQQLLAKIKSGATDAAAAEADLEAGLQAVDQLKASLQSAVKAAAPSQDTKGLAVQVLEKEVPAKFMNAVQQAVDLGLKLLHDMAGKAQFYRDRLAQAVRQSEHLALLKLLDNKQQEEHKKQRDNLQKMLQDVLAAAESAAKTCKDAAVSYHQRVGLMLTLPNVPAPPAELGARLEAMASQAAQLLHSIVAEQPATPRERPASRSDSPEKARSGASRRGGEAASTSAAATAAAAPNGPAAPTGVVALERKLAELEKQNREKDAQIAALLSAAAVEVPSPLPAMLASQVTADPVLISSPPRFVPAAEPTSLFSQPPASPIPTASVVSDLMAEPAAAAAPRGPISFAQAAKRGKGPGA